MAQKLPKHPQMLRDWILPDGTHVVADSGDDVQFDLDDIAKCSGNGDAPSVTDLYQSGKLQSRPQGRLADINVFTAAEFNERFMAAFNAAGRMNDLPKEAAPVASPEPNNEPSKTE